MKTYSISLRVWHPTLTGADVADGIGQAAAISQDVGQPRATPKGTIPTLINKDTYCVFDFCVEQPGSFAEGVLELLPRLERIAPFLEELHCGGGAAELYVWIFPGDEKNLGFVLERAVMRSLDDIGLRLSVELYID